MLKLYKNLKPYWMMIIGIILLIFLQSIAQLFLPNLMSDIVDIGIANRNTSYIWRQGLIMALVSISGGIATILASFFSAKVSSRLGRDLRKKLFNKVESFSLNEFDKIGTASLINRTTNDITQIERVTVMILRMVVMAPIMCIGGIVMAISKDAKLSLVVVVSVPFLFFIVAMIFKKGMPLFKIMQTELDDVNLVLRENLTGIRVIRAFNKDNYEKNRFDKANTDLTNTSIKVNKIMAVLMPFIMLIMNLTTVAVLWFGSQRINIGAMGVGDLMAFIQYIMQIMFSLIMVGMMFIMIPRASASAIRINEVLDTESSINDERETISAKNIKGHLEFRNVSFSYHGASEPAISHLSFHANPGETIAIIGGTGSGKSTIVNLIPRFYDASDGSIKIDGVDIKNLSQKDLRSKIGLVPQNVTLFSGSIKDNIRYGKEDATDEEVIKAAQIAQATDFINEMENGFDSFVTQGGTNISGGQKQRLSIARAIVRKPEIYLFDDSFSALDYKTDAKLRKALKNEIKNSTVIIVAQRISNVMDADRIIVLDNGVSVGIGTHEELLENCQIYQEIVSSQFSKEELA